MYIYHFISTSTKRSQSNRKQFVLSQCCWFTVGFQKAENWLWMWKKSDLRCLKAPQEGCVSFLGCKHQAPMTALRSPNDPARSRAHLTLLTAPDIAQTYPGTQCLPQRGCRSPQSRTTLPTGPAKPDPPGGWCSDVPEARSWSWPRCPLACLSWMWGQAQAGRSSETPFCPHTTNLASLKTSWWELRAWYPIAQWFLLPTKAWFYLYLCMGMGHF